MTVTRDPSQNRLLATLGFYMQGLPAIFVRTEIVFVADPNLSHYIVRAVEKGKPDFSTDEVLKGCELFLTYSHELRHFHDALLSRPLFKLFMLQNTRLWNITQLPNHLSGLCETDLPFRYGEAIRANVSTFGWFLINQVHKADQAYAEQQRSLYRSRRCLGKLTISLVDLLEANAMVAELLHLSVDHGVPSAEQYYRRGVCQLPPEYNKLLNAFISLADDFLRGLVALQLAVAYCLYGSDDPVARFCRLADEYARGPGGFTDRYNPQAIGQLFDDEAELEEWVNDHRLVCSGPKDEVEALGNEAWFQEMTRFREHVYAARKALISKYVNEFQMNAADYYHRTNELPLPPVVFWPGDVGPDGQAMVVAEDILRNLDRELYMIRGGESVRGDQVILAGIAPYMIRTPFVRYEVVDTHMLAYYWYRMLFTKRCSEVYSPVIDNVYEDLFVQRFCSQRL